MTPTSVPPRPRTLADDPDTTALARWLLAVAGLALLAGWLIRRRK